MNTNTKTDTPRTDAVFAYDPQCKGADLARTLERENAALREALRTVDSALRGEVNYEHAVIDGDPSSGPNGLTPAKIVRRALKRA